MTDMPDFDSMSPEEMMKWMESLAKRQGATEGLTTSADMDVAEVAADDERLAGKGDYVPYGWTEDKWKEHLAKEEAEKKAKQAASPPPQPVQAAPPPPQPEPEPEPVAAAASADAMPDFDSMSPEEMMKWMESLAKRQGATEGLTTSADMQVAEVSADDERLAGKGDYVPYGWTEDKWKEHLAKEEAQKKARQAEQPPAQPVQVAPPQPEPEPEFDDDLETALAGNVLEAPSLDDLFGGNNIIEEEEPEEEPAFDMPSFDDLFAGEDANEIPDLDLSALEGLGETANAADDPLAWLAGLSGGEEEAVPDIDLDALSGLSDLGAAEPVAEANPMDWLAGLADDSDMLDEAEGDTEEGSLQWLESLARREGADSEELVTSADLDIPMPDNFLDDGPGYEDFSFEQGSGIIADDEDEELVPSFDLDAMDLEDPENWLDQLAQSQSGTTSVGFGEVDEDEAESLSEYDDVMVDIQEKINQGTVSPEEIELFFRVSRTKADARTDVPDYLDSDDEAEDLEVVEAPVQAEIPDWLQETLSSVPDTDAVDTPSPRKGDTAEMMLQNLGFVDEAEDLDELPDWLNTDAGEDTGDITVDIFDIPEEVIPPTHKTSEIGTEEVAVIDTSDTWVQAFQQEASGELEEWYEGRIAEIEGGAVAQPILEPVAHAQPEPIAAVSAEGLQIANLPLETTLEHGEAMLVPAWLGGEEVAATDMGSVEAAAVGEMDWLSEDATDAVDVDMPDWLKEQVDDTVAPAEELPAWLAGDDIDIESVEEIPDWLRETMGEEEAALAEADFSIEEEPAVPVPAPEPATIMPKPEPVPTAITSAPKSPAPVPKVAAAIDVSAAFQAAEQKVGFGDIEGAMLDYESIVRSNQALEQVEKALDKLAKADVTKRNPAVFRVLGDVRMRQGKLQEALDTYRRALNML